MLLRNLRSSIFMLAVTALGCSGGDYSQEYTGSLSQETFYTYSPAEWASYTVGIARRPWDNSLDGKPFVWYNDGWACRGSPGGHALCAEQLFEYSAPNNNFGAIAGVGIRPSDEHVFAWYLDATVSEGSHDNLTAFSGKLTFNRPSKPGGGLFNMSDLLDVDGQPYIFGTPLWSYYWRDGNVVYRTRGSHTHPSSVSTAQQVTVSSQHGAILGISMFDGWIGDQARVEAWYQDGFINISTNHLNLAQP